METKDPQHLCHVGARQVGLHPGRGRGTGKKRKKMRAQLLEANCREQLETLVVAL